MQAKTDAPAPTPINDARFNGYANAPSPTLTTTTTGDNHRRRQLNQQNTGLWNFQNLNNTGINTGVPQSYQRNDTTKGEQPFSWAPKLVESGNTNEDKAPGQYSIPDKATVTSEARKRLGANTLALVKAGFDFKTAQSLASDQYQNDVVLCMRNK